MRSAVLCLALLVLVAGPAAALDTLEPLVPCIAVFHGEVHEAGGTLLVTPEGPIFWTGNDGVVGPAFFEVATCTYLLPDGSHLYCYADCTYERPDHPVWKRPGHFERFELD